MSAETPQTSGSVRVVVQSVRSGRAAPGEDRVVVEEPLEIRLGERPLLVTMRTPGHDFELVRGLLFTEGLVDDPTDVTAVAHCRDVEPDELGNVATVSLRSGVTIDEDQVERSLLVSAACGVCGKARIEAVRQACPEVGPGPALDATVLAGLPDAMRAAQAVFEHTGGLHAAALFDARGRLLALREDVGRHNAVDKVIGEAARFRSLPLADTILLASGRAGFEIVQKALRASIPVVASVSAPSSLAVQLAQDGRQTLVGFLRGDRFNVYAGGERFDPPLGGAASNPG